MDEQQPGSSDPTVSIVPASAPRPGFPVSSDAVFTGAPSAPPPYQQWAPQGEAAAAPGPPPHYPPPQYHPQPIYVTQQVQMAPAYVAIAPKSMATALVLTFLFGPLGLFYASVTGGIVMLVISVLAAVMTWGLSGFITWPICVIWAAVATSNYNARLGPPQNYNQYGPR